MPSKTPVSILQELCNKHKIVPIYTLIADGTEDKMFAYEVCAFDLTANGCGRNKATAKHEAAINLITKLKNDERYNDEINVELQVPSDASPEIDAVSMLFDICVDRNLPMVQFQIIQAYGASHAPVFVIECRIASISRLGTFGTKKGAKQMAAKEMLAVLQDIQDDSKEEQKMQIVKHGVEERPKTYCEYKKSEIKVETGVKLSDRYKYFAKLNHEVQANIKEVLYNTDATDQEKVDLICNAMNCKYKNSIVSDHPLENFHLVEICCEIDLCFANTVPEVYTEILDYMKIALSFVPRETTLSLMK